MKKSKTKNKKNASPWKTFKFYVPKHKILYSIMGVAGAGLVINSAIGKTKRQAILNNITTTFQGLKRSTAVSNTTMQPNQKLVVS